VEIVASPGELSIARHLYRDRRCRRIGSAHHERGLANHLTKQPSMTSKELM
jgi:hypothetical protein